MKIGIVGCGNLGSSILEGIIAQYKDAQIIVSKRDVSTIKRYESEQVQVVTDNAYLIQNSEIIILTLKPYTILSFLEDHKAFVDKSRHTIISCATGISISEINNILPEVGVYRAMPNTAAAVNESITAIASNEDVLNREASVQGIFKVLGEVVKIEEGLMESATILGACGVAFVLRFMRAMIQGGIEVGFDAKTASKIVSQTVKGAAELIIKNGSHPEEEIDKVTTPKGCTIVGLNEMEHSGFSSSLIKGIVESYKKIER